MRINGKLVKATQLFLGNEYKIQVKKLDKHFGVPEDYHRNVEFNYDTFFEIIKDFQHYFKREIITDKHMLETTKTPYDKFEHAYHQLMIELITLQIKSIKKAIGSNYIKLLYINGRFSNNELYKKLLSHYLKKIYSLKKYIPFIIK